MGVSMINHPAIGVPPSANSMGGCVAPQISHGQMSDKSGKVNSRWSNKSEFKRLFWETCRISGQHQNRPKKSQALYFWATKSDLLALAISTAIHGMLQLCSAHGFWHQKKNISLQLSNKLGVCLPVLWSKMCLCLLRCGYFFELQYNQKNFTNMTYDGSPSF